MMAYVNRTVVDIDIVALDEHIIMGLSLIKIIIEMREEYENLTSFMEKH